MRMCTIGEIVKMFLFNRWMAMNYEGVMNGESSEWLKGTLLYFEKYVLPIYIENGTYNDTVGFFTDSDNNRG